MGRGQSFKSVTQSSSAWTTSRWAEATRKRHLPGLCLSVRAVALLTLDVATATRRRLVVGHVREEGFERGWFLIPTDARRNLGEDLKPHSLNHVHRVETYPQRGLSSPDHGPEKRLETAEECSAASASPSVSFSIYRVSSK